MAAPDVRRALRVSGRLCWNPTDLSGSYPFGGTALGLVRSAALRVRETPHVIRAEEFGGIPVEAVYTGEEYVLACVLSSWDADAVSLTSEDSSAGGATGRRVLSSRPGASGARAGSLVSSRSGILYFSPESDSHPGVLFRKALPFREGISEWALRIAEEFGIPQLWLAVPDADGDTLQVGLRQDLSL